MIDIILQNNTDYQTPDETSLRQWVNVAIEASQKLIPESQRCIYIRIIDKQESAQLNQHFRQRHGPTNILSFCDENFGDIMADSLGDLAICAELLESEAAEQHKSLDAHWAHLIVHGSLHLLGFDHIQPEEANRMEALEIAILKQLNFANPYLD